MKTLGRRILHSTSNYMAVYMLVGNGLGRAENWRIYYRGTVTNFLLRPIPIGPNTLQRARQSGATTEANHLPIHQKTDQRHSSPGCYISAFTSEWIVQTSARPAASSRHKQPRYKISTVRLQTSTSHVFIYLSVTILLDC